MAFDAGTIKGSLDLDTTSFQKGFNEAHTHAQTEGGRIREILQSIAEVASEIVGPALGQMGQTLQSVFAGFSEGPVIGTLNALGAAAGALREAVGSVGGEFQRLGIEATKAGVSAEFLERFANVAKVANVGLEQVGNGLKILEERAESAVDGDKKATEAFERLGISATQLAQLMKDGPQALFESVQGSVQRMTSAFDRQTAAHDLLGRAGANLIPTLSLSKQEFDELADTLDRLKGTTNESTIAMGEKFAILQTIAGAAFEGIERAAATPILQYLVDHSKQAEAEIEKVTAAIKGAISGMYRDAEGLARPVLQYLASHAQDIRQFLQASFEADVELAERMYTDIAGLARPVLQFLADHAMQIQAFMKDYMLAIVSAVEHMYSAVAGLAKPVLQYLADHAEQIKSAVQSAMKAVTESIVWAYDQAAGSGQGLRLEVGLIIAGFEKLKNAIASLVGSYFTELQKEWNDLSHSELRPYIQDLEFLFQKMGDAIGFAATKASELRTYLESLAGIDGSGFTDKGAGFSTAGTRDPGQARRELQDAGAIPAGAGSSASSPALPPDALKSTFADFNRNLSQFNDRMMGNPGSPAASTRGGAAAAAAGGSNTYNVTVNATTDARTTAAALAAQILPAIQQAQKANDQKLAGQMTAKMAASGMGGGG